MTHSLPINKMMLMLLLLIIIVFVTCVVAYPNLLTCDHASDNWNPGGKFNQMKVDKFSKPNSPSQCGFENIPSSFEPCNSYTITINVGDASIKQQLAYKIVSSGGKIKNADQGSSCLNHSGKISGKATFTWTAPPTSFTDKVKFNALCGTFGGPVFAAQGIESSPKKGSKGSCPQTQTTQTTSLDDESLLIETM
jgi:hypothetical protein